MKAFERKLNKINDKRTKKKAAIFSAAFLIGFSDYASVGVKAPPRGTLGRGGAEG